MSSSGKNPLGASPGMSLSRQPSGSNCGTDRPRTYPTVRRTITHQSWNSVLNSPNFQRLYSGKEYKASQNRPWSPQSSMSRWYSRSHSLTSADTHVSTRRAGWRIIAPGSDLGYLPQVYFSPSLSQIHSVALTLSLSRHARRCSSHAKGSRSSLAKR